MLDWLYLKPTRRGWRQEKPVRSYVASWAKAVFLGVHNRGEFRPDLHERNVEPLLTFTHPVNVPGWAGAIDDASTFL